MSRDPASDAGVPRLSVAEFFRDVSEELFHADRGLPYTAAMLCVSPQKVLRGWLERRDARYVKPFRYFLIAGAAAVALGVGVTSRADAPGIRDTLHLFASAEVARSFGYAVGVLLARLWNEHLQWTLLMLTPFLAMGLSLLHRPATLNLAESWVCCLYAMGHSLLFGALLSSLDRIGLPSLDGWRIVAAVSVMWVWIVAGAVRGPWLPRLLVPLAVAPVVALLSPLVVLALGYLAARLLPV